MEDENVAASDNVVTEFATYEDFLDSQITPLDLYYLEVTLFTITLMPKLGIYVETVTLSWAGALVIRVCGSRVINL